MKKCIFKILIFLVLLTGLQVLWGRSVKIPDTLTLVDYFFKIKANIIYFGDSAITWTSPADNNPMGISDFLQSILVKDRILKIARPSYSADIFKCYLDYVFRKSYKPQVVIIPINLRSFSPEWELQPLWQFDQLKFVCEFKDTIWMKFSQPLGVFKYFEPRMSRTQYEETKIYYGHQYLGRVKEFDNIEYATATEERIRKKLLFRYLFKLEENNRTLQSLLSIADTLKAKQIQGFFYVMPMDVDTISLYLGPEFEVQRKQNVDLIAKLLSERGFTVLDLSSQLPSQYFTWVDERTTLTSLNEHLNQLGRMFVVKSLIEKTSLKKRLVLP